MLLQDVWRCNISEVLCHMTYSIIIRSSYQERMIKMRKVAYSDSTRLTAGVFGDLDVHILKTSFISYSMLLVSLIPIARLIFVECTPKCCTLIAGRFAIQDQLQISSGRFVLPNWQTIPELLEWNSTWMSHAVHAVLRPVYRQQYLGWSATPACLPLLPAHDRLKP